MFREEKNLKDSQKDSLKDTSSTPVLYVPTGSHFGSYTKVNKLITALYMVTDIIDKDEPLRNKLRTLGTGIISYTFSVRQSGAGETASFILNKISEIMSFLDIASAMGIISEMNSNILKKEFAELTQSIKEANPNLQKVNTQIDLSEFFSEEADTEGAKVRGKLFHVKGHYPSIGHQNSSTRIGVQKGNTLLKALNGIKVASGPLKNNEKKHTSNRHNFDLLKKERETQIVNLIKIIGDSATIKDIKDKAQEKPEIAGSLISCGEKTLQRELVSMVQNGVLNKMGEKRWSRYFVK